MKKLVLRGTAWWDPGEEQSRRSSWRGAEQEVRGQCATPWGVSLGSLPEEVWDFQSHKAPWDRHPGTSWLYRQRGRIEQDVVVTRYLWLVHVHPEVNICALSASWLMGMKSQ